MSPMRVAYQSSVPSLRVFALVLDSLASPRSLFLMGAFHLYVRAGEGFAGWAGMAHLTSLSLQNASMVSDAGCCAIARITSLRTLNLKNCPALTDDCLAALTPLERLCHLRLQVHLPWSLLVTVGHPTGFLASRLSL